MCVFWELYGLPASTLDPIESKLLEKLQHLPPEKLNEVEDIVDFLVNKSRREAAFDRLLAITPAIESAGLKPISDDEVVALVKQLGAERRAGRYPRAPGS